MASRRIVYGLALLAALAFQIFYDGYLAQFLLVCLLALPALSLLLSLPGLAGLRLALSPSSPQLAQGQEGQWRLTARSSLPLPVARLTLRLTFHNALTGATAAQRLQLAGLASGQTRPLPLEGDHCGALTCQVTRARALDFLGLFSLPVRRPDPAQALVLPQPVPLEELPGLEPLLAQTGMGPGSAPDEEDEELRDYRPGDPIRAIHWKLSSKYDALVVRERALCGRPQVALSFDLFGPPARLDRVLARVWTASRFLAGRGLAHEICWTAPDGQPRREVVDGQGQLLSCMARILSQPAPAARPQPSAPLPHSPGLSRLHITAGEEDAP